MSFNIETVLVLLVIIVVSQGQIRWWEAWGPGASEVALKLSDVFSYIRSKLKLISVAEVVVAVVVLAIMLSLFVFDPSAVVLMTLVGGYIYR